MTWGVVPLNYFASALLQPRSAPVMLNVAEGMTEGELACGRGQVVSSLAYGWVSRGPLFAG